MKEEIMEVKKEVQELREQSFAMEILKDYKRAMLYSSSKSFFFMFEFT